MTKTKKQAVIIGEEINGEELRKESKYTWDDVFKLLNKNKMEREEKKHSYIEDDNFLFDEGFEKEANEQLYKDKKYKWNKLLNELVQEYNEQLYKVDGHGWDDVYELLNKLKKENEENDQLLDIVWGYSDIDIELITGLTKEYNEQLREVNEYNWNDIYELLNGLLKLAKEYNNQLDKVNEYNWDDVYSSLNELLDQIKKVNKHFRIEEEYIKNKELDELAKEYYG